MTSNTPNVSERLSHTFATWQTYWLGHELMVRREYAHGRCSKDDVRASMMGSRLADAILDHNIEDLDQKDWIPNQQFDLEDGGMAKQLALYYSFPMELFQWNRCSRRAFHIPHSLEAMLAAAEFPEMRWDDVLWPFESFVITIEKPVVVEHPIDGNQQPFDTILVSRFNTPGGKLLILRWLHVPPKTGKRLGFTAKEMRQFRTLLSNNKLRVAAKMWGKKIKELSQFSQYQFGSQRVELNLTPGKFENIIVEPQALYEKLGGLKDGQGNRYNYDESTRSFFESLSVTIRIVAGWMLYLENLSSKTMEWQSGRQSKTRIISGGAPSIITDPDQICTIVGKGRIDLSEVTSETNQRCSKGFVRPHWRRAHYRRPAGSAFDAPKSQRVPPVLVRADLVPLYGIVGGTTSIAISKD